MTPETVLNLVATVHGGLDHPHARQHAMYELRRHCRLSLTQIGRMLDVHHTTVLGGVRSHAKRFGVEVPQFNAKRRMSCKIAGCDGRRKTWGMCSAHASRVRRRGDPMADVPIGRPGNRTGPSPEPPVRTECEVCGGPPLGGSRWCAVGGCGERRPSARWSWSRSAA